MRAGVDGRVEVLAVDQMERVQVACGWESGFGASDVESDDAGIAVPHGELGDLVAACGLTHRRENRVDGEVGAIRATAEPVGDGGDDFIEREPCFEMQFGSEADLCVDDTVGGQVLRALDMNAYSSSDQTQYPSCLKSCSIQSSRDLCLKHPSRLQWVFSM